MKNVIQYMLYMQLL